MTLAAVWIEARPSVSSNLCFASDSRTTPGPIDGVTKVQLFRRQDIAAVWAGDFRYASLVVNHLDAVLTASAAMRSRDIDVARAFAKSVRSIKQHLRGATQPLLARHEINRDAQEPGRTTVLVGGYSFAESAPVVLRIDWIPDYRRWDIGVSPLAPDDIVFIGDDRRHAAQNARRARERTRPLRSEGWRMEPLAAIHRAVVDQDVSSVGGHLQLAKAHMHGTTHAYGMLEPAYGDDVFVLGHPVEARAVRELAAGRLLVNLSAWHLTGAAFSGS